MLIKGMFFTLKACSLPDSDVLALSNTLIKAVVRKHRQKKIGKNLLFTVFTISGQKHDVIIHKEYYILDLKERKEYFITNNADKSAYDRIFKKITYN